MSSEITDPFSWSAITASRSYQLYGRDAYSFIEKLYPLCRSITGKGTLDTLKIISNEININIKNVSTGTQIFDWVVPKEWNIRSAYIEDMNGNRVVDFENSNLHIVSYSLPVDKILTKQELDEHLHSIVEHPDWIPYRTSYYNDSWGFCITENQRKNLKDDKYRVYIDSDFKDGNLHYGEYFIKGDSDEEFLIFTHICHPSLCNDNLSGISIATQIAKELSTKQLNKSYRFVFAPATIGSISWLSQNMPKLANIKAGLVLAVAGDAGNMTYKLSRNDGCYINKIVKSVLESRDADYNIIEFSPYGYDERQFCSPGVNLPIGSLMRTPNGCYPEYHTSADDLDFVKPESLADTISAYFDVINVFDNDVKFKNLAPFGEPQLGKRGLYRKHGGLQDIEKSILAKLWVLNLSDGDFSLLDIAEKSKMDFRFIQLAAEELYNAKLLENIK